MHHTAGVGSPSIARVAVCGVPFCLLLVCLFLVCLFLGVVAPPAWAHGGRFIPPAPPLGPPPPPMIPVIPPPTPPGLGGPGPVTPPVTLPPVGTPGTLPGGGGGSPFAPRARRAVPQADPNARWQTWWNLNRLAFLPDRDAVHRRTAVTPRPGETPDKGFWAKKRLEVGGVQVLPFLLGLVDPKAGTRDDLRASALLALGKIAHDEAVVRVLLRELAEESNAQLVRESAALALGLIRRSEPALAFDPLFLDEVRQRLLDSAADARAPVRTRAFAVLAVGLLGDQAFGSPYTKDGRLVIRTLWQRLGQAHAQRDVPIALLTALGLQPAAGVPDGVREGLRRIVSGKSVHGRRWNSVERGHALATALRLGGPDRQALLLRVLRRAREERDVKRAAYLALDVLADTMTPLERRETAKALLESLRRDRDPLSRGLGQLGLGHLLGADLRVGETGVLSVAGAGRALLSEARSGSSTTRGFSVLGLALALRGGKSDERAIVSFLGEARRVLSEPLEKTRGMRASCRPTPSPWGSPVSRRPVRTCSGS